MRQFSLQLLDGLARGKRLVIKDMLAAIDLQPERYSRWCRTPGFLDWLDLEIEQANRRLVNPMHHAQMQIAIGGSLPHYQTQLRRLGLETPGGAIDPTGQVVNGVQVHVHGIPERAPFASLPPPMDATGRVLSAPTSAPAK